MEGGAWWVLNFSYQLQLNNQLVKGSIVGCVDPWLLDASLGGDSKAGVTAKAFVQQEDSSKGQE